MKVCGVIAEYNPFHNGHAYHLNKTKELLSCDAIVAVMSGNFVQRGTSAIFDKWTRTEMALRSGVDMVVELPTYYACASAEFFAQGGIGLLDSMGIVDFLSFGAKTEDIDALKRVANILYLEPEEYKALLQTELKKGVSFPTARSNALKIFTRREFDAKFITDILLDPNNVLGIEYLKALMYNNSKIIPNLIFRKGEDYNSTNIVDGICSSTAIRKLLEDNAYDALEDVMPKESLSILNDRILQGKIPMSLKNYEKEIFYALRKANVDELLEIADVTEGLENILKKCSDECYSLDSLIESIKSKRYTRTRIQRILLHVLLNITKEEVSNYKYNPQYIRVLGFNQTGEKLLSEMYNKANVPVVTSVAKYIKGANSTGKKMIEKDIMATNVYMLGYQIPEYKKSNLDYTMPIIKL